MTILLMSGTQKPKRRFIRYLPVYGCISTGMIYIAVGIIAILALLRIRPGGADESSLMALLESSLTGRILIWVILFGMVSYVAWRIYETAKDPYQYGKDRRGLARRTGIALSSVADALIAYSAVVVLLGTGDIRETGEPEEQRQMVGNMLQEDWGNWLIIGTGAVILLTAAVQFFYGITRGYRERLDIAHFNREKKKLIHLFAWMGYSARGIILGIIGFFFMKAGFQEDPELVVNTDKAFNFIGENIGNLPFLVVAIGTISYGLFMFALGITYDMDNDPSDPNFEKQG